MAITHVNTQTGTESTASSVSANKPTGTTSGDLLIAVFSSNSQNCTPPSGWTEMFDEPVDVFRCQVFRKIAGGSEPSSYTFSVDSSAPLVLSITALRGINTTTPININPVVESGTSHSEPYTTPSVSGGTTGRLMFLRTVRCQASSPATFTASGVTELADVGVFSGGSVSYSMGLYLANSEYDTSGSQSGLAITASDSESHNVVATWGVTSTGVPGTMEAFLPLPTMTASGSWALVAGLEADLPLPEMETEVFAGEYEGTLDTVVPIDVDMTASLEPTGTVDISVPISIDAEAETRHFSENVMPIEREERWLILTQEGYRPGVRTGTDLPMRVTLPGLSVTFSAKTDPFGNPASIATEAFDATTTGAVEVSSDLITVSSVANSPSQILHIDPIPTSATANNATVASVNLSPAGHASVTVEGINVDFTTAALVSASVVANNPTTIAASGTEAFAGHAIVTASNFIRIAQAGHASATVDM